FFRKNQKLNVVNPEINKHLSVLIVFFCWLNFQAQNIRVVPQNWSRNTIRYINMTKDEKYLLFSDAWNKTTFTVVDYQRKWVLYDIHGLKDKVADLNNDGQVMLSELQNYLRTEVTKLSNGAQQPTSRIENLTMDFRIWL
ncbi:MAG: hypothetical protein ACK5D5_12475, partial [Bacteroidota bacterium]